MHNTSNSLKILEQTRLYSPYFEKENCGFGLTASIADRASHELLQIAIMSLYRMTHRGGVDSDGKTGDGCGLLIKKPQFFFAKIAKQERQKLSEIYAVGNIFFSKDDKQQLQAKSALSKLLKQKNINNFFWRKVPVNSKVLGTHAGSLEPYIEQLFVNCPNDMDEILFNSILFTIRRRVEIYLKDDDNFYITSLHSKLISYKGLVMPKELGLYYLDLQDTDFKSSAISYHQRFSTNTFPKWSLAQPFRFLAHNGELNTIKGNRNWAVARQNKFTTTLIPELKELKPLVSQHGSDSCSLDNMLEILYLGGMDIFKALRLLIPPAWQNSKIIDQELKAFLELNSMHIEPWDGPAGLVINTGDYAICAVDRNGLRPTRYLIEEDIANNDQIITFASEIGVYDYNPDNVIAKGTLKPGGIIAVDFKRKKILDNNTIDYFLKTSKPYKEWLDKHHSNIDDELTKKVNANKEQYRFFDSITRDELKIYQKYFLLSLEEQNEVLYHIAVKGVETTGSMGDDTPFAVLSQQQRSIFDYFRQMFAQVTNPPIDPLRENIVMSLSTYFGKEQNIFEDSEELAKRVEINSPILTPDLYAKLTQNKIKTGTAKVIDLKYKISQDGKLLPNSLRDAIDKVNQEAISAVRAGVSMVIIDDSLDFNHNSNYNLATNFAYIPALLSSSSIHQNLVKESIRTDVNIIVKTATARDPHHMAVLLGYGATAIYPYLSYAVIADLYNNKSFEDNSIVNIENNSSSKKYLLDYFNNYRYGINKGILKILSKMGISTIASYRGSQLFEAVGLATEVVDKCFTGTISRIEGADFNHLANDDFIRINFAYDPVAQVTQGGLLRFVYGGEYHAYNPNVVDQLRKAVRTGRYEDYKIFSNLVDGRYPMTIRDLFKINSPHKPIDIREVEPISNILARFDSAGISLGALSPEAHEAIAIAMNTLGSRSNSGEGGEDPKRFNTNRNSKIKQVASGRFGVSATYLRSAEVIQIKIAQGAKPGEGGQLPGDKVNATIAKLRCSVEGVTLISPPPHHDIYSIEDLAQLIYDLKQVNPNALVSVKLVAEPGVGTIAVGVVKAFADLITISGYDGGTGASPISSIKYAGIPFEIGIAETHKILRANNLRDKIILQADGGLKTGLDIIKAAILGAESFGFGTAPMVALGCKYLRICHLNTCAVGVATQDEFLREKHFEGLPQMVINYFKFVAEDVRNHLSSLGYNSLTEIIGRVDLLEKLERSDSYKLSDKVQNINLNAIFKGDIKSTDGHVCNVLKNEPWDNGDLAEEILKQIMPAIENKTGGDFSFKLINTGRSIGARISGEIAQRYGNYGMQDAPINLYFKGVAGQSFGSFNVGGLNMKIEGDCNDYVGKSMSGGILVVTTPSNSKFHASKTVIIGNTCLYGATGGCLYAEGIAGERLGVRNSGALAVVEGLGNHGAEYMTGGTVVSLGAVGENFGAGMSGGMAFILDGKRNLQFCLNHELVEIVSLKDLDKNYHSYLKVIIEEYQQHTNSIHANIILRDFAAYILKFYLIKPKGIGLEELYKNFVKKELLAKIKQAV